MEQKAEERMILSGELTGHKGWVTALATLPRGSQDADASLFSASRDKSIIHWKLSQASGKTGNPVKRFNGHNHFVEDIAVTLDGGHLISCSWDKTLRMWNLKSGETESTFTKHKGDVMGVAISPENTKIVSCGRDNNVIVWNILGQARKVVPNKDGWFTKISYSPNPEVDRFVAATWDGKVNVYSFVAKGKETQKKGLNQYTLTGFKCPITALALSPDGSLCVAGGKDGSVYLWKLSAQKAPEIVNMNLGEEITSFAFSPNKFKLCIGVGSVIKIWDLETKNIVDQLVPEFDQKNKAALKTRVCSLVWAPSGAALYSGYTDGVIRVWRVGAQGV